MENETKGETMSDEITDKEMEIYKTSIDLPGAVEQRETEDQILVAVNELNTRLTAISKELDELKDTMALINKENAIVSDLIRDINDNLKGKDNLTGIRLR